MALWSNISFQPTLEPLLREIVSDRFRTRCLSEIVPNFWRNLEIGKSSDEYLRTFVEAVDGLQACIDATSLTTSIVESLPHGHVTGSTTESILHILQASLSISQPPHLFELVEAIFEESMQVWEKRSKRSSQNDDANDEITGGVLEEGEGFWTLFIQLTSKLKCLKLLQFFADHAVAEVAHRKVKSFIHDKCSREFEGAMLDDVISLLTETVIGWIQQIYGDSEDVHKVWVPQIEYCGYKTFAELRIDELFDILVEFPDSEPALLDLKECLRRVELRAFLIESLRSVFNKRLLHPGANTSDIITQYISSIKGLRLLDPSGVILERVCDPVRHYLRIREDTVRCIVASLTDDSCNELADELVTGEPALIDLDEESESEDQDFESWEPDPVDADPTKSAKSRQTSDIISLLVNIYGSREVFVSEYRNLLADRLLQSLVYDTSREVRNLELLKLRFGENNLHFCEVMIKDIGDSKRINAHVTSQWRKSEEEPTCEVNAFILSHVFWPTFREEKIKLPDFIQSELDRYTEAYCKLKGMRTLQWKLNLGQVQVELELADRELSFTVSPVRAAIIYQFQDQSTWTVDCLSSAIESQPSVVRRHLGFWVSQGVLKEQSTDTFVVVEKLQKGTTAMHQGDIEDEEESAMASAEDQKESEFQVFWAYIVGMITSLGKMKLDRIHSMLKMFAMHGTGAKEFTQNELKVFLDKKVREQQLALVSGEYQLPK